MKFGEYQEINTKGLWNVCQKLENDKYEPRFRYSGI